MLLLLLMVEPSGAVLPEPSSDCVEPLILVDLVEDQEDQKTVQLRGEETKDELVCFFSLFLRFGCFVCVKTNQLYIYIYLVQDCDGERWLRSSTNVTFTLSWSVSSLF